MSGWVGRDLAVNWHPYTQMKDCETMPPLLITRTRGMKLYDEKGHWYYDTISSWWCNVHGHGRPEIRKAILRQLRALDHVLFAGFTHEPAIRLSEELIRLAPKGLARVFYSDDGSTAVETALKLSVQYWRNIGHARRNRFVAFDRGYHGDTCGAMGLGGVSLFTRPFRPLLRRGFSVPSPYCYRCPLGKVHPKCGIACLEPLDRLLRRERDRIAGLVIEPLVLAAGGMIVYPVEYLRGAARLAKRHHIHLILDEVATGFGRTGRMFACEHAGVSPDFLCLSKGLTGGTIPLAATLTTERIYRAFYAPVAARKTFYHGHTFTANPVACAAARASLEIFRREKTLARVQKLLPRFHRRLQALRALSIVGDVRCLGLIGALELVRDKHTKRPFPAVRRIGWEIYRAGLKRHLILRPLGDVLYLWLPLAVTRREMERILDETEATLREVEVE